MSLLHLKVFCIIALFYSCVSSRKIAELDFNGPPTMVYKLKDAKYNKLVTVHLSHDKQKITSYPAVTDIITNNRYPIELADGYLLDQRCVNENSAVLKLNVIEYTQLKMKIDADVLYPLILDVNPFVELYHCGNKFKFKNEVLELNQMIIQRKLKNCKCLIKVE